MLPKGNLLGRLEPPILIRVDHNVIHGLDGNDIGCVVRWRNDDPRGVYRNASTAQLNRCGDRPVGGVVVPAVIVGEVDRGIVGQRSGGMSVATQKNEPAIMVGADLAEIDLISQERAGIELISFALFVLARNGAWPGIDDELIAFRL